MIYKYGLLHSDQGSAFKSENGSSYFLYDYYHRENGPCVQLKEKDQFGEIDLTEQWIFMGVLHREDGPAMTYKNAHYYYHCGVLHRKDGPAQSNNLNSNAKEYYEYGLKHRTDGPSISNENQTSQYFYKYGVLHREDGPASIEDQYGLFYMYGEYIKEIDIYEKELKDWKCGL